MRGSVAPGPSHLTHHDVNETSARIRFKCAGNAYRHELFICGGNRNQCASTPNDNASAWRSAATRNDESGGAELCPTGSFVDETAGGLNAQSQYCALVGASNDEQRVFNPVPRCFSTTGGSAPPPPPPSNCRQVGTTCEITDSFLGKDTCCLGFVCRGQGTMRCEVCARKNQPHLNRPCCGGCAKVGSNCVGNCD